MVPLALQGRAARSTPGAVVKPRPLGLARLQSFYQRIHGPAISIALGAGCILLASMLYFTVMQSRLVIHELLISVFVLMTAPVVSMLIMRAAVYRDLRAAREMDPANDAGNS